jgi:hypothetical protein
VTRLAYVPLAVLTTAFVILCIHHGTAWPWNLVVHEDGHHTLLGTIFYFDHALGELPLDLLLSAAVAGAMLCAFPPPTARPLGKLVVLCLIVDALIIFGAKSRASYLFQFHTRDEAPMVYGSHWHYHFLSQAALMLLPLAFVLIKYNRVLLSAWVVFAALTIVFGISIDSFIDPRYLGHQARELFTHTLVTIPLAVAIIASPRTSFKFNPKLFSIFVLLSAYLAAGVLLTGARHHTQSSDWTAVICTHFFEHTFSYLVVASHTPLFYLSGARPA